MSATPRVPWIDIPQKVWSDVVDWMRADSMRYLNVFVAGGSQRGAARSRVAKGLRLLNGNSRARYHEIYVYYPEDYFTTLAQRLKGNLLELERVMAEHVDLVILCPESPGSFSELGAFANVKTIREKTYIIQSEAYAKKPSFINLGPIRTIERHGRSRVLRIDTASPMAVNRACQQIVRDHSKRSAYVGMFEAQRALVVALYMLEAVEDAALKSFFRSEVGRHGDAIFEAVTDNLFQKRMLARREDRFALSPEGVLEAQRLLSAVAAPVRLIDSTRLLALKWVLRAG